MTRKFQSSTDVGGESSAIQKAGTYHFVITHSADGESTRGKTMNGVSAILSVLAGTVDGQEEKEFHLHLYDPDMTKDVGKQEWSTKKQTAYGIAINQINPANLGGEFEVDFGNAEGQQIIATLGTGRKKVVDKTTGEEKWVDDDTKVELSYANIYHVDDPRAEAFPKSQEALALLPAEMRRKPEYFAAIAKKVSPAAMKPKESRLSESQLADL